MSLKFIEYVDEDYKEVLTLEEVKGWLRVLHSDDDALISEMIRAARASVEGPEAYYNRILSPQVWELTLPEFPPVPPCDNTATVFSADLVIPLAPVIEIVSVDYVDTDGDPQTIAEGDYAVDLNAVPARLRALPNQYWPYTQYGEGAGVTVRFTAGYPKDGGSPAVTLVPANVLTAMKILIAHWYRNREVVTNASVNEFPYATRALLEPWRLRLT